MSHRDLNRSPAAVIFGSPTAAEAVQAAMDLAKLCGVELHIVTGFKPERVNSARETALPEEFRFTMTTHPADRLLDQLAALARSASLDPIVHAAADDAAKALTTVAAQEQADLIVVCNKGMKGVRRVLGSVPNDVAHSAPCSVLRAHSGYRRLRSCAGVRRSPRTTKNSHRYPVAPTTRILRDCDAGDEVASGQQSGCGVILDHAQGEEGGVRHHLRTRPRRNRIDREG